MKPILQLYRGYANEERIRHNMEIRRHNKKHNVIRIENGIDKLKI